jgi:hypothetical protein
LAFHWLRGHCPDYSAAGDDPGDATGVRSVAWVVFEWSLRAVLPTERRFEDTEPRDLRLARGDLVFERKEAGSRQQAALA